MSRTQKRPLMLLLHKLLLTPLPRWLLRMLAPRLLVAGPLGLVGPLLVEATSAEVMLVAGM
jgi:hypothetical protein